MAPLVRADFERSVFLNVPFDHEYEGRFLALISGLTALGFIPRSALEMTLDRRVGARLQRLHALIGACRYSVHDLSRVECRGYPRFNMPFEAGMAFAQHLAGLRHTCIVLERRRHRLLRTCSDLNGVDPEIYGVGRRGIFRALLNVFGRADLQLDLRDLLRLDEVLISEARDLRRLGLGSAGLFSAAPFRKLVIAGQAAAQTLAARKGALTPSRLVSFLAKRATRRRKVTR